MILLFNERKRKVNLPVQIPHAAPKKTGSNPRSSTRALRQKRGANMASFGIPRNIHGASSIGEK